MSTETLDIPYPVGLEDAMRLTPDEMAQHIRLMAALKMFELGKLSGGKAAELAGMSRAGFYDACGRYRVSVFNYADDEADAEILRDVDTLRRTTAA